MLTGNADKECAVPGCNKPVHARSLCHTHYVKGRRTGDPTRTLRPSDWGKRDKHPLYERWKSMTRANAKSLDPAWKDFWQFVSDVGSPPTPLHRLYRLDSSGLWSAANVEWRERMIINSQKTRADKAAYMREYYDRSPHVLKRAYLRKHYGITLEEYNRLFDLQKGLCAICGNPETAIHHLTGEPMLLAYDHNHKTEKGRGLLCMRHNRGLGLMGDSIEILRAAIAYLEAHAVDLKVNSNAAIADPAGKVQ